MSSGEESEDASVSSETSRRLSDGSPDAARRGECVMMEQKSSGGR